MTKPTVKTKLNICRVAAMVFAALVFVVCLPLFVSCNYIFPSIDRITVVYNGGEVEVDGELNRQDILVTAYYTNKKSEVVGNYELQYDFSTAGRQTVTVSYGYHGQSRDATFYVEVKAKALPQPPTPPEPEVVLQSITAVYNGQALEIGDALNNADISVTAYYSDGSFKTADGFVAGVCDTSYAGQKSVEVTYTEGGITKRCNVTVTVVESNPEPTVTLEKIEAVYNGKNITVGGTLNNADISVVATYSDGSAKRIVNFSVSGFSSAVAGPCSVEIGYSEGGIDKSCQITVTVAEKIEEIADYGKYGILQDDGSVKITNTAIVGGDLQIHFLAFENVTSGDSIYIKAGDTDVLIDASSTASSSATIDNYIKKYCTDGVLEYVVATHAHSDHISGFVGTYSSSGEDNKNGIFDKYECDTIITYANKSTNSTLSQRFEAKRQAQKDNGANVYTALECYNNQNGASRVYKLSDNVEMEILYNYYYDHPLKSDENSHSVCLMINQYGDGYDFDNPNNPDNKNYVNHFLFTGDLEENGESYLVDYNDLPNVTLFKAGHHGSATASTSKLLQVIQPKLVCVCTCCDDANTYKFPRQEFIDRVAKFTDMVFLTNTRNGTSTAYVHLNGSIAVTSNPNGVFVNCSNNNILFKDSDWFKANRVCPPEWADE